MKEQIDNYKLQNRTLGQQDDNAGQMKRKTVKNQQVNNKRQRKTRQVKKKTSAICEKNLLSVIDLAFTVFISSFILSLAPSITYIESFAPAKKKDHDRPLCNNHYS